MAPGLGPDRSVGWGSTDRGGNKNAERQRDGNHPMVEDGEVLQRNAKNT